MCSKCAYEWKYNFIYYYCYCYCCCFSQVEDEIIASECELQDISITPLLNALNMHKTVAMLDLSHNLLGNGIWFWISNFIPSSLNSKCLACFFSNEIAVLFCWLYLAILTVYWILCSRKWNNGETSTVFHIRTKIWWFDFGFALQSVWTNNFVSGLWPLTTTFLIYAHRKIQILSIFRPAIDSNNLLPVFLFIGILDCW